MLCPLKRVATNRSKPPRALQHPLLANPPLETQEVGRTHCWEVLRAQTCREPSHSREGEKTQGANHWNKPARTSCCLNGTERKLTAICLWNSISQKSRTHQLSWPIKHLTNEWASGIENKAYIQDGKSLCSHRRTKTMQRTHGWASRLDSFWKHSILI